jgi:protocatechuate 3,4-dioxygenase beta subunit
MAFDLGSLMNRRRALWTLAGFGLVALGACGSDSKSSGTAAGSSSTSTSASSQTTTTAAASQTTAASTAASTTSCPTAIPEETAGPFPGDGSNGPDVLSQSGVVRKDITTSFGSSSAKAAGVPLTVNLVILDQSNGCRPIKGAAVYVWHCDRDGNYSMYSSAAANENYLRGVQETDADGRVAFTSIFPAAYSGRWPHIHFEIYPSVAKATSGSGVLATSQIALPEATCKLVYATTGYEQSVQNLAQTSLTRDMVFSDDGGVHQIPTVGGSVSSGFTVELSVPV